ncbi:helix-turn-helix domain-containing protein [Pseudonocardia sp. RS010]|uniref:helix-turn-helix domain-containing protein n=1 Tax=Pseudonocardia sp. RS010 TaxID=3385979 RepID=UPI0039A38DCC
MAQGQTSMDDELTNDLFSIGQNIRATRRGRLSLDALAKAAGVSVGLLSQLENGRGNPTLQVLTRIAAALEVEITDIVAAPAPQATEVVRAESRSTHRVFGSDRDVELLSPHLRGPFTVTEVTLPPGAGFGTEHEFVGETVIHVLAGTYTIRTRTETIEVQQGDTLQVDTASVIGYHNDGHLPMRAVNVYVPAEEE